MELSAITHEVAAIQTKVGELRIRSGIISFTNGLCHGVWVWIATLLVLGGIVLVVPMPGAVRASLVGVQVLAILWIFWRKAVGPIFFGRSRKDWALYCEELHPRLNKRLVTCLDIASVTDGLHTFHESPVAGLLLKQTAAEIAQFEPSKALPGKRALRYFGLMLVPFLLLGLGAMVGPTYVAGLFTALYKVDVPVTPLLVLHKAAKAGVAGLTIGPGDVEIARGGTVEFEVDVELLGEGALEEVPQLRIQDRPEGPAAHDMLVDESTPTRFNLALVDVQSPFVYQAAIAGLKTPEYTVTLYDPPMVQGVTAQVTPPAYTGFPAEELAGTFFSVHEGSKVLLTIESDKALSEVRLEPEEGDARVGVVEGRFARFEFVVDEDQSYRGIVLDDHSHQNLDPPLIEFEATPDKTPSIRIKRPGADWALHPIGELELRVEVDDDHGLQDVQFEYQINDGEVQIVHLFEKSENPLKGFTGNHILYLEDLDAALGDVVLYRVRARDTRPDQERASSYSQPYFLTIRPYEQDFFMGGSSGGGEGMQMPNQKEVIIATTRLIDREPEMDPGILAERSAETADTQRVIEDRTRIVLGKMRGAQVPNREERVAHLEGAIEAMQSAGRSLDAVSLRPALPQENSALSHLLAAFAGLPKGVPGQGGGGGGGAPIDLLGQKLDRDTQKYETKDGLPTSRTRELDEAIAKTKILAQRQKEFAETIRREREQAGKGGSSSSSSPSQQQSPPTPAEASPLREMLNREEMLAALEESQRELQKLKDAMLDRVALEQELSRDLQQALQSAAREMKRLNNAMRNEQWDEAQGANTRALEKMREVQLRLQQAKLQSQSDSIQALLAQVGAWKSEQSRLSKSTASLRQPSPGQSPPSRGDVASQQADLGEEALDTGEQVAVMTPMANDADPPDYMDLGRRIGFSGRLMKQASGHIESEEDLKAGREQLDVLDRLEKLEEELQAHLENQAGDELVRLREALASIEGMRERLAAELERIDAGTAAGPLRDVAPQGGALSNSPSESQSQTPAPGQGGASGTSGTGRISSAPRDQGVDPSLRSGGPAVPPTRGFDQRAMTVQLNTIEYLLDPNSPALPLVRGLEEIVASDLWEAPESGWGPEDAEFIGEFAAILDRVHEIMAIELAGEDQMQRLNQAGVENLPPRFREIASLYFESLATQAQEAAPTRN